MIAGRDFIHTVAGRGKVRVARRRDAACGAPRVRGWRLAKLRLECAVRLCWRAKFAKRAHDIAVVRGAVGEPMTGGPPGF